MIILIEGDNYFASLQEYRNQLKKFETEGYEVEELRPDLDSFDAQLDLTQNQGLFSSKTLYVLKDFSKLNVERIEKLQNAAQTIDILILHNKSIDKRKKFYKTVKKEGQVYSSSKLKGKQLSAWIVKRVQDLQLKIDRQSLNYLVMRLGDDQQIIESELDKLIKLQDEGVQITQELIEHIVTDNSEVSVWDLTDNLIASNKKGSIRELDKVMRNSEYEQVVGLIVSQLRQLYIASSVETREKMISHKIHPFVASKLISKIRNFPVNKLKKLYQKIVNMEIAVKTGKIDKELALDLLVLAF
ncbi:DNA polymerase III subunit delta [Candidatus Dojkabacteria bacterium]|nr:DNA polymerase III subunit delta [Candidatus Dojkabacteria bacterium]